MSPNTVSMHVIYDPEDIVTTTYSHTSLTSNI